MSDLAWAVAEKLKCQDVEDVEVIEGILQDAGISTVAAVPTPVRLLIEEVSFRGTKRVRPKGVASVAVPDKDALPASLGADFEAGTLFTLPDVELGDQPTETIAEATQPDAADEAERLVDVPFEFDWVLGPGLYGVGSHENHRGKSTVLEVIRWALRGRSRVQKEVRYWIEHVTVRIRVNNEMLVVDFDVKDGVPTGTVTEVLSRGDRGDVRVVLARFEDDESFERAMDAVMMPRLQLQPIMAWQKDNGKAVSNAWPAYSSALLVSSKGLDRLLGETAFGGMASRLLQMFVGGAWAASRAQAGTAVKATKHAITQTTQHASEHEKLLDGARERAIEELTRAETALAATPSAEQRLEAVSSAMETASTLGRQITVLRMQLEDAEQELRLAQRELDEEQHRRHALLEDALARRFFNALRPTSCPRCAAPVTAQRRAQEAQGHACSVCTRDLDLDAYQHEMIVAVDAPADEHQAALAGAALLGAAGSLSPAPSGGVGPPTIENVTEPFEEPAVDVEEALTQVVKECSARATALRDKLRPLEDRRAAVMARTTVPSGEAGLDRYRDAELAVAVARGAVKALSPLGVSRVNDEQ